MEPVVAAANPETGYGLSGVRLPPAVPSRVGGSIADCGGETTGPVAINNLFFKEHSDEDDQSGKEGG